MKKKTSFSKNAVISALVLSIGAASGASALDNIVKDPSFSLREINSNTVLLAHEGKCGESHCGESKTTNLKAKSAEAKCGEGKCGVKKLKKMFKKNKNTKAKTTEAKCGESKCGSEKKN